MENLPSAYQIVIEGLVCGWVFAAFQHYFNMVFAAPKWVDFLESSK